jgi:hypothetical protein
MTDKPLDCTAPQGNVGKYDFKRKEALDNLATLGTLTTFTYPNGDVQLKNFDAFNQVEQYLQQPEPKLLVAEDLIKREAGNNYGYESERVADMIIFLSGFKDGVKIEEGK